MAEYVFITGAAGGFGKATVNLLAKKGYIVFAADIHPVEPSGGIQDMVIPLNLDITDQESIKVAVKQVKETTTQLAGLVNIAGVFDQFPLVDGAPERFEHLIKANLLGQQNITSALFPLLHKGKGRIINLSSQSAMVPMPIMAYGLSKLLFDAWNTHLRQELALLDMKVIVIRAGGHKTGFIDQSIKVLSNIDENSRFAGLMRYAKDKGLKILHEVDHPPEDMAHAIAKALTSRRPKKVYSVNIDGLFRILSWLPAGLRERIIVSHLKKQNQKR